MASTDPFKAPDTDIWQGVRIIIDGVNIYRSNDVDEIVATSNIGYECVATKLSPDKKFYFLPYYDGWISVDNVQLMTERISTQFDEKTLINNVSQETIPNDFGPDPVVTSEAYQAATSRGLDLSKYVMSTAGVFAVPYQFSPRVDRRINDEQDGIGRKYAEKIISRNNLLYLTPGKQEFMLGASAEEKASVMNSVFSGNGVAPAASFKGRYYSLAFALEEYYKYVNPMCWATAGLLDLRGVRMPGGKTLGSYAWQDWLNEDYGTYAKTVGNTLLYYVDSFNEVSEDFGNDTRESSLVSTVNGYSDTMKEINYIMNYQNGELRALAENPVAELGIGTANAVAEKFGNGKGVIEALLGNTTTILAGGKLVFPELWNDSSFDRSYSINIKLRSPDSDPLSIYLNILVPFIHLLALTAPRNFEDYANGYISPFLVRAYFKGLMNIDLGIVTGLSVSRGGEGNWSLDNLPTSVDINLTIKDLYRSMYLADASITDNRFIYNDGEMDYLMNLAGVNTAQQSFERRNTLISAVYGGMFGSMGARVRSGVDTDLLNGMNRISNFLNNVVGGR